MYARDWEYPEEGLELAFSNEVPNIKKISEAFQTIISQLREGWKSAKLKDYININNKESEEEWYLFIKSNTFDEEDRLIELLASKLGLSEIINCHDDWIGVGGIGSFCINSVYLWIKKDSIDQFQSAFNFDLALPNYY